MWNWDITLDGIVKTFGIMVIGAMTVAGWLWTGSAWKTEVDMKLDSLTANSIRIEKKMDRNFDLLITEIRSLKK